MEPNIDDMSRTELTAYIERLKAEKLSSEASIVAEWKRLQSAAEDAKAELAKAEAASDPHWKRWCEKREAFEKSDPDCLAWRASLDKQRELDTAHKDACKALAVFLNPNLDFAEKVLLAHGYEVKQPSYY